VDFNGESIYSSLLAQSSSGGPNFILVSTNSGFGSSSIYSVNAKNFNVQQQVFNCPTGVSYVTLVSIGDDYVYGITQSFGSNPVILQLELASDGTLTQVGNYSAGISTVSSFFPDPTRGVLWFLAPDRDDTFLFDLYTLTLSTGNITVIYRNFTQGNGYGFNVLGVTSDGAYIIMTTRTLSGDTAVTVYDTTYFDIQDKFLPDYLPVIVGSQTLTFRSPVGGGAELLQTDYSDGFFGPALQFNQSITLSPYNPMGAIYAAGTNSIFLSTLNTAFSGNTIYQVSYGSSSTAPQIMSAAAAPYLYFAMRTFAKIMATPTAVFAQDVYSMVRFPLA